MKRTQSFDNKTSDTSLVRLSVSLVTPGVLRQSTRVRLDFLERVRSVQAVNFVGGSLGGRRVEQSSYPGRRPGRRQDSGLRWKRSQSAEVDVYGVVLDGGIRFGHDRP